MEDLRSLESNIIKRLDEIRNKDKKTLNELEEYKSLQEDLRMVHNVMRMTEINNELELNKLSEEVNNMSEEELIEDVVTLMKEENIEVCEDVDCVNVSKLMDKNEQLQGRIDKAIEYVEKNWITYEDTKIIHYGELNIEINDIQDLFQILKGDSNEMKKLYDLPEHQNIKLYIEGKTIIFGHLDGLYSYCWLNDDKTKIVHIKATTKCRKYRDGYKLVEDK